MNDIMREKSMPLPSISNPLESVFNGGSKIHPSENNKNISSCAMATWEKPLKIRENSLVLRSMASSWAPGLNQLQMNAQEAVSIAHHKELCILILDLSHSFSFLCFIAVNINLFSWAVLCTWVHVHSHQFPKTETWYLKKPLLPVDFSHGVRMKIFAVLSRGPTWNSCTA